MIADRDATEKYWYGELLVSTTRGRIHQFSVY